jgi:DNA polymerase-1
MAEKVVLLDGNSLLYRAFFALPPLTNAQGEMTNAVYGFATMLNRLLAEEKPDYIITAFDLPGPTFRHHQFKAYKATREKAPEELRSQIPLSQELLRGWQIPVFAVEGFEADDVLGTLARIAEAEGKEVLIVSGDMDVLQLVSDKTQALITRRGISETSRFDLAAIQEKYGLTPAQLIDFKALRGDPSDNIPGVPGIGEKTAATLMQQYGSLENLLQHVAEVKPARAAAALEIHTEQAKLSQQLATIISDVPLQVDWEQCRRRPPEVSRLRELYTRLEFRGLLKKLPAEATAACEVLMLQDREAAKAAHSELANEKNLTLALAAAPGSYHQAEIFGLALGGAEKIYFIPAQPELLAIFKSLLEEVKLAKITQGAKEIIVQLKRLGIDFAGPAFDTEIASHLADSLRKEHALGEIAFDLLHQPIPSPLEKGAPLQAVAERAAGQVRTISRLKPLLEKSLTEQDLAKLYYEVELPLIPILAEMEITGVAVDREHLAGLSLRLAADICAAEKEVFALAGEAFLINSPKQLQYILYEKLGLPKGKKTKTGYSTDAATLANLAGQYDIVAHLLEYRELSKLQSTYVEALPRLIHPATGRIHTTYNQAVTATGRLSSTDPNLQNIPIRTEIGREIRRAFVAEKPGDRLLAADYSQIELRVLAHISGDEALKQIFAEDRFAYRHRLRNFRRLPGKSGFRNAPPGENCQFLYPLRYHRLCPGLAPENSRRTGAGIHATLF